MIAGNASRTCVSMTVLRVGLGIQLVASLENGIVEETRNIYREH